MTRRTGAAVLLAVLGAGAGSPARSQTGGGRALRYGPHGVAVRQAAGAAPQVWYPGACARRSDARLTCTSAAPDGGRFPLLVYTIPRSGADTNDAAAVAYFVSHGYVVAWLPAGASAVAARAAVASWAFVDTTRSALWIWDDDAAAAAPWRVTVSAARNSGAFTAAIAGSGGARRVSLRLPGPAAGRLAVVIGRAFLDAELYGWGAPPEEIARRLGDLGLN